MSPFPLPVLFTAWTWKDGAGIAGEVIRRAKLGGFKTVAVQLSQDTGGDPGSSLDAQDVQYLHDAGLFVVGWDPVGLISDTQKLYDLKLDGWLPQVEGDTQRQGLLTALAAGVGKNLPKAIVTTYGGLDTTDKVAALKAAWGSEPYVFVECYAADGAIHADIPRMLAQGSVYGFDLAHLRALCGTYRGETTTNYPALNPTNYGGIYLEENTNDDQLRSFAAITPQEATPVGTPNPATLNEKIAALAKSWLDCFPGDDKTLTRLRAIYRIATSTDAAWVAERQDVVDALSGAAAGVRAELLDVRQKLASAVAAQADLQSKLNAALAKIAAAQKDLA